MERGFTDLGWLGSKAQLHMRYTVHPIFILNDPTGLHQKKLDAVHFLRAHLKSLFLL